MHLFSKAKKDVARSTPKDSVIKIRETLDMLEKREKYLQSKMDAEIKTAKAALAKGPSGKRSTFLFEGNIG